MEYDIWNDETPVSEYGIEVPSWIEQDVTAQDIAAIMQGGCASGAYMPAVTYYTASQTMAEYGDYVLQYIQDALGELPTIPADSSWSGTAVLYLSTAVELWACGVESQLEEINNEAA